MRDSQLLGQQQKERERKVGKNPLGFHKKEFRILVENWICSLTGIILQLCCICKKKDSRVMADKKRSPFFIRRNGDVRNMAAVQKRARIR